MFKAHVRDLKRRKEGKIAKEIKRLFKKKKEAKTAEEWFMLGLETEDIEKKVEYYTKALEIDPKYDAAWYNKGTALDDLKRNEEAIRCYDKALEVDQEFEKAKNNRKIAEEKLKEQKEKEGRKIEGKTAEEWFDLGFKEKDPEKKIEYYSKCLELNSKNAIAWYNKGRILEGLGRYEEAIRCFDKVLEIDPNYEKAKIYKKLAKEKVEEDVVAWYNKENALSKEAKKASTYAEEVVLDNEVVHPYMPKKITDAKIVFLEESLEIEKREEDAKIEITTPEQMKMFLDEEEKILKAMVGKIVATGANVVFCQKEIDDFAQLYLAENGVLAARRVKKNDIEKLLRTIGGKVISTADVLTSSDLGHADSVEQREIRGGKNILVKKYKEVKDLIKSAKSSIEKAKEFGCDVLDAEERLKSAEQLFGKRAYEEVIEAAKQIEELVKKIKEESKPEITIELSRTSFKPNAWERIDLTIKNNGTATAKEIKVEYPKERVEIEDLTEVKELKPNEVRELRIGFRLLQVGEVPLKTKIEYKDLDSNEYKEERTFWIGVREEEKENKKEQIEIAIERTIYDPCKRDFIEGRLPRMKEWINRYDPGAYWFAVSIQNNNTDRAIEEWGVELAFSSALNIKEAKIEGIEIEIPYEAHLNSYKISVPKEYGIVIPKGGAQRVYFKFRAEKPKTTYEISGIFKSAITGDVPIRAKEFKYLCDTGVSPEAVKTELKKTFPEKDAARLANTFRIAQEIRSSYCNTDTTAREINKEFDLLKMYLTENEFLDEVEGIQRKINAELREDERLDDKHVEEVKDFCEKFTEMWIARFLR